MTLSTQQGPIARSRTLRARRLVALLIALALVISGVTLWSILAPGGASVGNGSTPSVNVPVQTSSSSAVQISMPGEGGSAVSVFGADDKFGPDASTMLASHDADARYPLASVTKIITTLMILDAMPLQSVDDPGPTITFTEEEAAQFDVYNEKGASVAPMPAWTEMTQRDALAMMLIPSASNYASVMMLWAYGDLNTYLDATRAWLDSHGLTETTIVEPTGFNSDNQSSPRDMLVIGRLAAENPVIADITARTEITLLDGTIGQNTNTILGIDGVTGGKTGNLGEGNYVLLYTASLDVGSAEPVRVVGISMGGQSRESVAEGVQGVLASIRKAYQ